MRGSIKVFFIIIFFLSSGLCKAQGFDAALLLGFNAAQIDGDGLVGYHKVGLHAGLRASYPLQEKMDLGLELLFSQRGSRSAFDIPGNLITQTTLNYLSVPIFVNYKDWYIEDGDYYKVRVEGGLSYGFLFRATTDNMMLDDDIFREHDLSLLLGVAYAVNKRLHFGARWTNGLIFLIPKEMNTVGTRSYYLTFRVEYHL